MEQIKKEWGLDKRILWQTGFDLHVIYIKEGGKCSRHKHLRKYNYFFVIEGELLLIYWYYDRQERKEVKKEIILSAESENQSYYISPGKYHQFLAKTNVVALEVYYNMVKQDDIIRYQESGI